MEPVGARAKRWAQKWRWYERNSLPWNRARIHWELMLEHARGLLRSVGYGSGSEPFVDMGVGLDIGEAFVGNIGQRALYDFTAVGDVVNTASRLQHEASGGEIVLSDRVAAGLSSPVGTRVELALKGKSELQAAYRTGL